MLLKSKKFNRKHTEPSSKKKLDISILKTQIQLPAWGLPTCPPQRHRFTICSVGILLKGWLRLSSFLRPPSLLFTQGLACCITHSYDSWGNLMKLLEGFFPSKAKGFSPQFSKYFQDSYLLNAHHKPTNCTIHGGGGLVAKSCPPLLRPHGL